MTPIIFMRRAQIAVGTSSSGSGEPFFAPASDITMLADDFEVFTNQTDLFTYQSHYTGRWITNSDATSGYSTFPSPDGGHSSSKAFRNIYPASAAYIDKGGLIEAGGISGAPSSGQFVVVEWWWRVTAGSPLIRTNASQNGDALKVFIMTNNGNARRYVFGPHLHPSGGPYWGGLYDSGPASGVYFNISVDGSGVAGTGTFWYFQNMNVVARDPVSYMGDSAWHYMKCKFTQSTSLTTTTGDGKVEAWVDGAQVIKYDGTDNTRPEFNQVLVSTTMDSIVQAIQVGGPWNGSPSVAAGDQWADYDDIRIWARP